jgi:hypothetical protein
VDYLPPELDGLERRLSRGPRPEPSAALRLRVLRGVRSALWRQYLAAKCRFAAAFAAIVLLAMGLSLGVRQATAAAWQQRESRISIATVARQLQTLSPGLSREQSLRLAASRHIGAAAGGQLPLGDTPAEREVYDP